MPRELPKTLSDLKWGERPLALVVRDNVADAVPNDVQIKDHLRLSANAGAIPKFAIPDHIVFVADLPKTSVGKFDKKALRQQYSAVQGSG